MMLYSGGVNDSLKHRMDNCAQEETVADILDPRY